MAFKETPTLRNASVAFALTGGIGRYLYASSYSYDDVSVAATHEIPFADPIVLPLLSTESLDAMSVGSEYARIEKMLRVAEIPDSYTALDVCARWNNSSGYRNCGSCWKCLRTLATRLHRHSA